MTINTAKPLYIIPRSISLLFIFRLSIRADSQVGLADELPQNDGVEKAKNRKDRETNASAELVGRRASRWNPSEAVFGRKIVKNARNDAILGENRTWNKGRGRGNSGSARLIMCHRCTKGEWLSGVIIQIQCWKILYLLSVECMRYERKIRKRGKEW